MFLGGFILTAPLWVVGLVPPGSYPSIAIQLGTLAAYGLVLVLPIPLWKILRRFPGCQAAIITLIAWEVLVIRWFCVEDDRTSRMSKFLCVPLIRNIAFLGSMCMIVYAGTLAWHSARNAGTWPQRLWIVAVLVELFILQEFYRNGGTAFITINRRFEFSPVICSINPSSHRFGSGSRNASPCLVIPPQKFSDRVPCDSGSHILRPCAPFPPTISIVSPSFMTRTKDSPDETEPLLQNASRRSSSLSSSSYSSNTVTSPTRLKATPLPLAQLFILALVRLAEPINFTLIFPFVNQVRHASSFYWVQQPLLSNLLDDGRPQSD